MTTGLFVGVIAYLILLCGGGNIFVDKMFRNRFRVRGGREAPEPPLLEQHHDVREHE